MLLAGCTVVLNGALCSDRECK